MGTRLSRAASRVPIPISTPERELEPPGSAGIKLAAYMVEEGSLVGVDEPER